MKKKIEVCLNVIFYMVTTILSSYFVVTNIKGHPCTLMLIVAAMLLMLKIVNMKPDKKEHYVLIALNTMVQSGLIIFGSFSDNVAAVFIMFVCNIYILAKRKQVRTFAKVWLIYGILCEIIGILQIIDIVHIKSGICSVLTQGMIADIAFIVIAIFIIIVNDEKVKKYAAKINILFLIIGAITTMSSMTYLHIQKINYKPEEIDIEQVVEGKCVIESELLKGQVITRNTLENSDSSLVLKQNSNSDAQIFTFRKDERGVFVFTSDENIGLVIKVTDGGTTDNDNVCVGIADGGRNEEWILISQEDGGYSIASIYDALRMDYDLMKQEDDVTLIMYEENGNSSQRFRLYAPNDNKILSEYIAEIKGMPLVKVFKSLILCIQIAIVCVVLDWIFGDRIRKILAE